MHNKGISAWGLVVFLCYIFQGVEVFADTSLNVPVGHWSYDAIEKLAIWGMVDMSNLSKKPISRIQMARCIAEVIKKTQDVDFNYLSIDSTQIKILEQFLKRLIEEFRNELVEIGVGLGADDESHKKFFKTSGSLNSKKSFTNLDVSENILENEAGWHLRDGLNIKVGFDTWFRAGDFVGFALSPGVRHSKYDTDLTIERGYLQGSLYNIRIQVGRDSLWWGPGYHGSLLLSNNAFPFDMIRVNNDTPLKLPLIFEKLGPTNIEYFITRLEEKRQISRSYFSGLRLEFNPVTFFNFGFSRTIIFGGKGAPRPDIADYLQIFLPEHENKLGILDNDQKISVDFRLRTPLIAKILPFFATDLEIYGELAGEDDTTDITQLQPGHAINGGVFIPNLLNNKGLDMRIEFAQNDEVWYIHHAHGSYRYKDSLIGHHMGTDSNDIFIRISKQFLDELIFGLQFSRERSGRSLAYIQTKNELRADITLLHTPNSTLSAAYEFEDIDNIENISGNTARNHIFLLEAYKRF